MRRPTRLSCPKSCSRSRTHSRMLTAGSTASSAPEMALACAASGIETSSTSAPSSASTPAAAVTTSATSCSTTSAWSNSLTMPTRLAPDVAVKGLPVVGDRRVFQVVGSLGSWPAMADKGDGRVLHGAGDGADGVHRPHAAHQPVAADPSPAGAQADYAAPRCRAADGASGVLA